MIPAAKRILPAINQGRWGSIKPYDSRRIPTTAAKAGPNVASMELGVIFIQGVSCLGVGQCLEIGYTFSQLPALVERITVRLLTG
jgi:hypothetical protein